MSALSDELQAVVLDLLSEFGESVTVTSVTEGAYNPADGSVAAGSTSSFTANAVPLTPRKDEKESSNVLNEEVRLILYHATGIPKVGDKLTYNSVGYRVLNVTNTRLSGESLLYEIRAIN